MTSSLPTAAFRKLSPYATAAGALFSILSALVAFAGYFDLERSFGEYPKRFIVSAVMTLAFATSLGFAAFISFRASAKLRRVSDDPTDGTFALALDSLVQFLRAFFIWVVFLGVMMLVFLLMPVY